MSELYKGLYRATESEAASGSFGQQFMRDNITTIADALESPTATSASFATTASFASMARSGSYAVTASFASKVPASGIVGTPATASFATTASFARSGSYAVSSSWAGKALASGVVGTVTSASYAVTASYALNGGGGGGGGGSSTLTQGQIPTPGTNQMQFGAPLQGYPVIKAYHEGLFTPTQVVPNFPTKPYVYLAPGRYGDVDATSGATFMQLGTGTTATGNTIGPYASAYGHYLQLQGGTGYLRPYLPLGHHSGSDHNSRGYYAQFRYRPTQVTGSFTVHLMGVMNNSFNSVGNTTMTGVTGSLVGFNRYRGDMELQAYLCGVPGGHVTASLGMSPSTASLYDIHIKQPPGEDVVHYYVKDVMTGQEASASINIPAYTGYMAGWQPIAVQTGTTSGIYWIYAEAGQENY